MYYPEIILSILMIGYSSHQMVFSANHVLPLVCVWCTCYPCYYWSVLFPGLARTVTGVRGFVEWYWVRGFVRKCDGSHLMYWEGEKYG